ncbi:Do family serine endopeptidase [Buchnera aphidicola (Taiwanaphis decaspermi)]|uniref:Do family serine endopeptidase n=1 Tax=Buchnera aphidicola TaxID=9 RepID=UPI0031B7FC55
MKKIIHFLVSNFLIFFIFIFCKTATSVQKNLHKTPPINREISLSSVVDRVNSSIVSITIEGNSSIFSRKLNKKLKPLFGKDSLFCHKGSLLYGSPLCEKDQEDDTLEKNNFKALGSGVIFDAHHGYIVTNNHVIDNARKIQVKLNDGSTYLAKLIGADLKSDIAVIKLKKFNKLTAIKIGNSDKLKVGDYVLSIGNPYGLNDTVTFGIISALNRSGLNIENYENFIQTDAAINKGNSGGALVNINGELIGINTAILSPTGGNIGIGFSIPSNIVKSLIKQILRYGHVKRGQIGIIGSELNSKIANSLSIDVNQGVFINKVLFKSSAFFSGIHEGDIIIAFNKKPIYNFLSFRAELGSLQVGSKIQLTLLRDKRIYSIKTKIKYNIKDLTKINMNYPRIEGAKLNNYVINKKNKGVIIELVIPNTHSYKIGFVKKDIIISINNLKVNNLQDLKKILKNQKKKVLAFKIRRHGKFMYLFLQ